MSEAKLNSQIIHKLIPEGERDASRYLQSINEYRSGYYPETKEDVKRVYEYLQIEGARVFRLTKLSPSFTEDYHEQVTSSRQITGPIVIAIDPVTEGSINVGKTISKRLFRSANSGFFIKDAKYDLLAPNGIIPCSYVLADSPLFHWLHDVTGDPSTKITYNRSYVSKLQRDITEAQVGNVKIAYYRNGPEEKTRVSAGSDLALAQQVEDQLNQKPPFGFQGSKWYLHFIDLRLHNVLENDEQDQLVNMKLKIDPEVMDTISFKIRRRDKQALTEFTLDYQIQPTGKFNS